MDHRLSKSRKQLGLSTPKARDAGKPLGQAIKATQKGMGMGTEALAAPEAMTQATAQAKGYDRHDKQWR